jgi:hypothetical protein
LEKLQWVNDRKRLGDLLLGEFNPRQIYETEAARLVDSFDLFGQALPLLIGPDLTVYDGHQRKHVWEQMQAAGGPDLVVDVRVASRTLTQEEQDKLTLMLHKGTIGHWDFDDMSNRMEPTFLLQNGFTMFELQLMPAFGLLRGRVVCPKCGMEFTPPLM